jgi:hypothetical protein
MADSPELPDPLLFRTVDIVLANRQSLLPLTNFIVGLALTGALLGA